MLNLKRAVHWCNWMPVLNAMLSFSIYCLKFCLLNVLYTVRLKFVAITDVTLIPRNSSVYTGVSTLGRGITLASFQALGHVWIVNDKFHMILITGISTTTFSSQAQNGKPSGPVTVFLIFDKALNTCVDDIDVAKVSSLISTILMYRWHRRFFPLWQLVNFFSITLWIQPYRLRVPSYFSC